jgi:hypothetical protein
MISLIAFFIIAAGLAQGQRPVTPPTNMFSAGQLSPLLDGRTDIPAYKAGTTLGGVWDAIPITGAYPMLHELDASEIPSAPAAPTIADGTTPVSNATELQAMSGSGSYILVADVNMLGVTWTPIASFSGTLDGDGHTISNLTINNPTVNYQGLFHSVHSGFKCKDLNFVNCTVIGKYRAAILLAETDYTGPMQISINNVTFTGCEVQAVNKWAGVLGGNMIYLNGSKVYNVTITDCTVKGPDHIGGLAGAIDGEGPQPDPSYFVDCVVNNITMSSQTGLTNMLSSGGFAGTAITWQFRTGTGFIAFYGCSSTGTITNRGLSSVGGFIGSVDHAVDIVSCSADVDILATDPDASTYKSIGGFVGAECTYTHYIDNSCVTNIDIDCVSKIEEVAGFIGFFDVTDYTICRRNYSTGSISLKTTHNEVIQIGGFSSDVNFYDEGRIQGPNTIINRCWTEVDITINAPDTATVSAGGFICDFSSANTGYETTFNVSDCYTWSEISCVNPGGSYDIAGFIRSASWGVWNTQHLIVERCYSAQTDVRTGSGLTGQLVYPTADTAGFFLLGDSDNTVTASYWDTTTSGITATPEWSAIGQPTCAMWDKTIYEAAGWSFSTVDQVKGSINDIWYMPADYSCSGGGDSGTPDAARLIPFVFSTDDSYILAFDAESLGFLRTSNGISGRVQE